MRTPARFTRISLVSLSLLFVLGTLSVLAGLPVRNWYGGASGADTEAPWASLFNYRRPVWSFVPNAVAVPFAGIVVTTTADTIDAAGNCVSVTLASLPGPDGQTSLREAICAANTNVGADTITFSVNGTFALTGAANEDNGGVGDFDIKQSLSIQGNGAANTIIDGSGIERIFDVFPSAASNFDLSNLTVQNGDTRTVSFKEGGAMYLHNNVTTTISNCQIISNFSGANGAIENRGTLTITGSTISNNQTIPASGTVVGGGLRNAGTLSINNSTISNNTVRGEGGGIAISTGLATTVTITNSTISGNTASVTGGGLGNGGGISTTGNDGTINLTNVTISGNRADNNGGGAYFITPGGGTGNATLNAVTITNNTADNDNNAAGAGGGFAQNTAAVTLRNTIVAGNFNSTTATRDDISGAVVASSSYNLIGDGTGSSGISNGVNNNQVGSGASPINPLLGTLANNTGPTETHALLTGSPAINTANNATSPATDQRGIARPVGGVSDIGSFELADITPPDTTITSTPSNPSNSSTATFTFTGSDSGGSGLAGFQCRIDGGGFTPCTSPQTYLGLADGSHTFQVRAIDGFGNVDPTPASFTWTIISSLPPTISKVFGAASVPLNGSTSLTFTITNPNAGFGLTGVSFTDTLPAGLVVATPNGLSGMCNGTVTATAGTGSISLSGGSLSSGGSCTIAVNVTGTSAGAKNNSVAASATGVGTGPTSSTATLNVFAPPTVTKFFVNPNQANSNNTSLNGTARLSISITNPPGNAGSLNGLAITDTFPTGLEVDATPSPTNTCGGTFSPVAGATSISFSGGGPLTVGNQCSISVVVKATTVGALVNTTGNVSSTEGGTGGTASGTLNVFAPPTIAKAFGASVVSPNTPTTMTFTITNPAGNPGNLTGVGFNDTLLSGLQIAPSPGLSTSNCGSPTTTGFTAGSTSLMVSGATVATANPCVITVNVRGTLAGTVNNTTTAVTATNGGTGVTSNTATLIVASPPSVAKDFAPNFIPPGGTSTVTITLQNPNATLNLTGALLTDTLPAGLTTVNGTAATTCGGTATQTTNSVSLSGGTIPMNSSCSLTVDVTSATNNVYTNTIAAGDLTTANSGPNPSGTSDTLIVADPPTISKAFAPNPITSGGTSTLTITLNNPNSNVALSPTTTFTDTLPANVTTVGGTAATTCGGTANQTLNSVFLTGGLIPTNGSCTLTVDVTSGTPGGHLNTIAAGALVTNGGTNANPATATLVVGSAPQVDKTFAASALKTGATTTLTISITNNNPSLPFNGVDYTDTLPTGLTVPDAAATGACGGTLTVASNVITLTGATIAGNGGNCTTTFTVTGTTVGVKNNTVTVNTTNFGTGFTDTATVTVYDVPTITKGFAPTSVPFGGTSTMSFVLTNPNSFSGGNLAGLSFSDTLPSGITVATSGPTSVCGGTLTTTAPGTVSFSGGTLGTSGPGNTCTINVTVTGSLIGMHTNTVTSLTSTETGANPVNASATLTVTASPTTTTITNAATLSSTPTVVGQPYAVNVTVAPAMGGMGLPTGTVNVSDGTGATCTITLSGGSGTCNLTSTTVGTPKTITASYLGDTNFATSSTTATHTVNKADTTLSSLTDSPDPSVVGQAYTVGFTLNVTAPGAGTPSGTVTVNDGAGGMCTATLPATSCQLTSTVQGNKTVTFTYNGDANFNPSTATAGHAVNKADTTVAITNDTPDPSVFGQNYAVTAAVSVTA